jgi:CheY-like chemotaxis protein/DNA-binding CsgD family transcriptional regulator
MNKILIVDDHVDNIHLISGIPEGSFPGVRLFQALNAAEAIGLCGKFMPDLIISDWEMPGMTGIDMIRTLKADPKTAYIPAIIVSAIMLTPHDLEIAFEAGAHDYVRSPLDPVELTARVHSAMVLSRCHREEILKKNAELIEKTLILVKSNEFIQDFSERLQRLETISAGNNDALNLIRSMIDEIDQKIKEDSWQRFEIAFQNIHTDFIKNLLSSHPQLTSSEVKLCSLLKLGMNTKDMSSMLYISPESLKVSRSRLRNKLSIPRETSFHSFFSTF